MGERQNRIGMFEENPHRFPVRESRRRNCLTETTLTPFRRAALIRSRSRFRSSSRVTRYCDLPLIAPSKISLSSGSRQIFRSPEVWTIFARAAIRRTNISTSSGGDLNRSVNRGRLRTSPISASCEREVTAVKWSRRHLSITCPGGPVGLRKAETQTLVSSRATSGTTLCLYLGSGFGDLRLDFVLRERFCPMLHAPQQSMKFTPPLSFAVERDQDARLFLQSKPLQRPQYALFVDRGNRLFRGMYFSWRVHALDYNDRARNRQDEISRYRRMCWQG